MVSVPPPSSPRRKETVLKLCVVSLIVWCCALPVPRRKENIPKLCVVSSSMQNGVCPAALIAATQGNCPETLRHVLDRVVLRPSHAATQRNCPETLRRVLGCKVLRPSRAATQGKRPKTLRRGRYVKNIVHSVNNSLNLWDKTE